jgi:hypothetical protein
MLLSTGVIPIEQGKHRLVTFVDQACVESGERRMVLEIVPYPDLSIRRRNAPVLVSEVCKREMQIVIQTLVRPSAV